MSIYQLKRKVSASALNTEGQSGFGQTVPSRWGLGSFAQDTAGDVAILFGLMATTLFLMIGSAVDLGRWLNARDHTMAAIDSAILAGGRTLQTRTQGQTTAQAQAAAVAMAKRYYDQAVLTRITIVPGSDTVSFSVTDNGTAITAAGNAQINTPFMSFAGVKQLPLMNTTGSDTQKAILEQGGNVEISVMLDTSGSMAQSTSSGNAKITDMRSAATDLVDIIVSDDQSQYKTRVALVPFSGDVRLTAAMRAAATDPNLLTWGPLHNLVVGSQTTIYKDTDRCVSERTGVNKYTDVAPGLGNYVMKAYDQNAKCDQDGDKFEVVPLSSDKVMLKDHISKLVTAGGTAGQVGTAWAYYMLSPNWSAVVPSGSEAVAYGTPKTQKVAILMTDGEYNVVADSMGRPTSNGLSNNSPIANSASSPAQAIQVCTQMKASGIEVYTVGFDVTGNSTAISTLTNCATDTSHFYNAADGNALRAAFRDIGLKISKLHLAM